MTLAHRIRGVGSNTSQAMAGYHPAGNQNTPMAMPIAQVTVTQAGLAVNELTPIYAADGAPIPATAPGSWGQLVAAGRP